MSVVAHPLQQLPRKPWTSRPRRPTPAPAIVNNTKPNSSSTRRPAPTKGKERIDPIPKEKREDENLWSVLNTREAKRVTRRVMPINSTSEGDIICINIDPASKMTLIAYQQENVPFNSTCTLIEEEPLPSSLQKESKKKNTKTTNKTRQNVNNNKAVKPVDIFFSEDSAALHSSSFSSPFTPEQLVCKENTLFYENSKIKVEREVKFTIPKHHTQDIFFSETTPVTECEYDFQLLEQVLIDKQTAKANAKKIKKKQKSRNSDSASPARIPEPEEEEITKLRDLLHGGFVTPDEFERRKAELTKQMSYRFELARKRRYELKKEELEQKKKMEDAQFRYRIEKMEEEQRNKESERLRAEQMRSYHVNDSDDDDTTHDKKDTSDCISIENITRLVRNPAIALQIFEYLVDRANKTVTEHPVSYADILPSGTLNGISFATERNKIRSMADVLHVLHVSGQPASCLYSSPTVELTPSQVTPTREVMHFVERIAQRDPTMVRKFLKQVKTERRMRTAYQREMVQDALKVSKA